MIDFDYDLAADGRRDGVTETDDKGHVTTIAWEYDGLSRLVSETFDGYNAEGDAGWRPVGDGGRPPAWKARPQPAWRMIVCPLGLSRSNV